MDPRAQRVRQQRAQNLALVDAAIADGRVRPQHRAKWLAQINTDPGAKQRLAALFAWPSLAARAEEEATTPQFTAEQWTQLLTALALEDDASIDDVLEVIAALTAPEEQDPDVEPGEGSAAAAMARTKHGTSLDWF